METRRLARGSGGQGIFLVDAPVSGGVKRAISGTLAIMAGAVIRRRSSAPGRCFPPWAARSSHTGAPGSGHAVKALNNYVSAAGLVAACEAVLIAEKFGVDPNVLVDVLNVSTGKNNSTELQVETLHPVGQFRIGLPRWR